MANTLSRYRLGFSASHYVGSAAPAAQTLSALGVTSAKVTSGANGADSLSLTIASSLSDASFPFLPLAKHTLYGSDNTVRFVGWLAQPGRKASGTAQGQTFVFEGPNYLLRAEPYMEPWAFATDPTNTESAIAPQNITRAILFRDPTGAKRKLADQVAAVLDFAIAQLTAKGKPTFAYGSLAALPEVFPTEDEQQDRDCLETLDRIMHWAPMVTRRWEYGSDGVPTLQFVGTAASTLTITPDDPKQGINGFDSAPRYDLLVASVTVNALSEQEAVDGDTTVHWATRTPNASTAENGSIIDKVFTYTLRGQSNTRLTDGTPLVPKEELPTGLAAALHEPFKTLFESLQWYTIGSDADWGPTLGMFVSVQRVSTGSGGGTVALRNFGLTSRSAIRQIVRTIETGRTDIQAGPPTALGLNDLLNLRRAGANRNSANAGTGSSGYTPGAKGPETAATGKISPAGGGGDGSGGSALGPHYFTCAVAGELGYVRVNADLPISTLPTGESLANPE